MLLSGIALKKIGARLLPSIACLKRISPLSFMPLVPYPARSTRHLPLEGKAVSVVIPFPHMRISALTMREKPHSRIVAFPIGEGGPRSGALVLVYRPLEMISLALFHPSSPIQPPPLRGTSFHRKEGVSTRGAPSLGRGCRARRGGVGFLLGRRSPLLFAFPIGEGGPHSGARVLS